MQNVTENQRAGVYKARVFLPYSFQIVFINRPLFRQYIIRAIESVFNKAKTNRINQISNQTT